MSYILDALRKAESERKLGSVPDVHAQPAASATSALREAGRPRAWIIWVALAALLTGILSGEWYKPWQQAEPDRKTAATVASPVAPPVVAPSTQAAPAAPRQPQAQLPKPAPSGAEATSVPAKPASRPKLADKTDAALPATPTEKARAPAPVAALEERVGTVRDLPENIQRELPAMTVGGYIYAKNPADRSMLINKRLLREGDDVAPGLKLEKMMPTEAVLSYRGYRYRISY